MKKIAVPMFLMLAICLAIIPLNALVAEAAVRISALTIQLDGKTVAVDAAPFIDGNGRTMVPVRFISEALGAQVDWDRNARVVTVTEGSSVIKLTIDSPQIITNGKAETMDTTAVIKSDRTFVPVRYIAEALGLSVGWDGAANTVILTSAGTPGLSGTDADIGRGDYILSQIYLGMTEAEANELLGEPVSRGYFNAGSLRNEYTNAGSLIFNGRTYYEREAAIVTMVIFKSGKVWDIYELVSTAVKQHNMDTAAGGEYLAETHQTMAIDAGSSGFTVKALSQCDAFVPDGEYNVRLVRSVYTPLELTFAKNAQGEYELTSYRVPESGEKWDWAENPPFRVETLKQTTYSEAMDHFVGGAWWDSAYGIGG